MQTREKHRASAGRDEGPREARPDWDALQAGIPDSINPDEAKERSRANGGVEKSGDLAEENDDNAFQGSDEALPDDREERAIWRDPDREGSRFDEI
jgi:hypothetical protein